MCNIKTAELTETESNMVVTRNWGWWNWNDVAKGYELATRRGINPGDLMHSIMIIVNNIVL